MADLPLAQPGPERPPVHPLVAEAMRKTAMIWIEVPGQRARAAWAIWHDGAAYLVHGGGEQPMPGLAEAAEATVVARSGDQGARVAGFPAAVAAVDPASEEWSVVAPLLLAKRLNLPDPANAEQRWATGSVVSRLVPAGGPEPVPEGSLAESPAPTPAATQTTVPRTFHKKPRRR
jgi:hypothetical protein